MSNLSELIERKPDRRPDSYEWVDLPVGPQPIPDWCTGLAIGWADGYGNIPGVCLKTNTEALNWPDKRFVFEGDRYYRAYSDDGRLEQHAHSGQLSWQNDRQAWVSTPDEGYGGSSWEIMMKPYRKVEREGKKRWSCYDKWSDWKDTYFFQPGRDKVILVGPWHVGAPTGYIEVSYVDTSRPDLYWKRGRRWYDRTARAGLYITDELWLRLIARYQPTLRVARCFYGWSSPEGLLEPVREDWDEPKAWAIRKARLLDAASSEAADQ